MPAKHARKSTRQTPENRESYGLPVTLRENGSRDKEHDCSCQILEPFANISFDAT
jgi:hypothetical protein